jgi:hypothetical protein
LILARASPERYEELARTSVLAGEICWTPPALDRGRLYVRNQQRAACIYVGEANLLDDNSGRQSLTVADIPQGKYHDLAAILGVEPEYAFDVPSDAWLRSWYQTSLAILVAAGIATAAVKMGLRFVLQKTIAETTTWAIFWTLAFFAGVGAMTPLSHWRNEFVFTWPVSLFVAFQATMHQVRVSRRGMRGETNNLRSRLVALMFLAICVGYYVLCRRLSLVFEWAFLCGFGAAIPVSLVGRWLARRSARPLILDFVFTAGSFSAYYWGSVAWLWWKYPQP